MYHKRRLSILGGKSSNTKDTTLALPLAPLRGCSPALHQTQCGASVAMAGSAREYTKGERGTILRAFFLRDLCELGV